MNDLYNETNKQSNENENQNENRVQEVFEYKGLKLAVGDGEVIINNVKIDPSLYKRVDKSASFALYDSFNGEYTLLLGDNTFLIDKNKVSKINGKKVNITFKNFALPYEKELLIAKIRSEKLIKNELISAKILSRLDVPTLRKLDNLPNDIFDSDDYRSFTERSVKRIRPDRYKRAVANMCVSPFWATSAGLYWSTFDAKNPFLITLAALTTFVAATSFGASLPVIISENKALKRELDRLAGNMRFYMYLQNGELFDGQKESKNSSVLECATEFIEKEQLDKNITKEEKKVLNKVLNSKFEALENGVIKSISKKEFVMLIETATRAYTMLYLIKDEVLSSKQISEKLESVNKKYYQTDTFIAYAKYIEEIINKLKLNEKQQEFFSLLSALARDEWDKHQSLYLALRLSIIDELNNSLDNAQPESER